MSTKLPPKLRTTLLTISLLIAGFSCKQTNNPPPIATTGTPSNELPPLPNRMTFFESPCDLTDLDVRERLDRELLVNAYFQSSTSLIIKRSTRYFPIIEPLLKAAGVPDDFKYLCVIESNLSNVTSPAGAAGFWQFMPFTAPEYGLKISNEVDERLHLEKSTQAACALIKSNYTLFNHWINACAAYNRGPGGLMSDLKGQRVEHFFDASMNPETSRYVFRIMAMKIILENPKAYGFHISPKETYPPYQTQKITLTTPITNLSEWASKRGFNLKIMRILNPWILGNQLSGKSLPCILEIPRGKGQFKSPHTL